MSELFFENEEYLKLKIKYEAEFFKLNGGYVRYRNDVIEQYSPQQMKELFIDKKIQILKKTKQISINENKEEVEHTKSKISKLSFFDIWRDDPNKREYDEVVFDCDINGVEEKRKKGIKQFNLFTGFNHFKNEKIVDVDLEPVLEHIRTLCNYKEETFKHYLTWLSHIIQHPEELEHILFVFISKEGVGKDEWYKFLEKVFGEKYVLMTSIEKLSANFNSLLECKLLIFINETDANESAKRAEIIKDISTAQKITIEKKYKDAIQCKNYIRLNFFSNQLKAFPVDGKNRRPVIIQSSSKYVDLPVAEKNLYFTNLRKVLSDKDYQYAFQRYLLNYKSDINLRDTENIKSDLHKCLEENSIPPIALFIGEKLNGIKTNKFNIHAKSLFDDYREYMNDNNYKYTTNSKEFAFILESQFDISKEKKSGNVVFIIDKSKFEKNIKTKYGIGLNKINGDNHDLDGETNENENDILKDENVKLKNEIVYLKSQLEEMKKLLNKENIPEEKIIKSTKSTKSSKKEDDIDEEEELLKPTYIKFNPKPQVKTVLLKDNETYICGEAENDLSDSDIENELDNLI